MVDILDDAIKSNAWPFIEAKKILEHINYKTPEKGYVLFETGYGPSGLPHIGTFGEVARVSMVRHAFMKLSDIPTRLYCFSDDMDGLRKVPSNIPNGDMVANYIGMPLTGIPDPFEEKESYGHYMNAKLRSFLDRFGFEYEFFSATDCYKSGIFDHMLIKVLEKYDDIMNLMLPTFREERQATYSPFMPVCPKTGKVLQVPIKEISAQNGTVSYEDEKGELITVPVTKGGCKLQWKPDFGMRWAALDVDYEMYGKDHLPNAPLYTKICEILGGDPPVQLFYELFLNEEGQKISKSKGNSITVDEWLQYAPIESMALFMYQSPGRAKRLFFDVIPKSVDEYLTFNKKFFIEQDVSKKLANPCYHIHNGEVPKIATYGISFALLLNLASVCNPDSPSVLWGFISKYAGPANAKTAPYLDKLVERAINYYNDFVKNNKNYLNPNDEHKKILQEVLKMLDSCSTEESSEQIQNKFYDIGMNFGYDEKNLRGYFKDLYQILLGQIEGPRLGSFVKLYGIEETKKLIQEKLK